MRLRVSAPMNFCVHAAVDGGKLDLAFVDEVDEF
jgi:hypothetical protein